MPAGDQRGRLIVRVSDEHGRAIASGLARWLRRAAPATARGRVNVALVSDARIRALNHAYRRKNVATDVLSFPASAPSDRSGARAGQARAGCDVRPATADLDRFLGDIVIARGVARRQAKAAKHPEITEWRVLALHGLLHLLGYDHESDDGAMARLERRLRRRAGLREGLIERVPRR
jgi:probable rRNA maturation factor